MKLNIFGLGGTPTCILRLQAVYGRSGPGLVNLKALAPVDIPEDGGVAFLRYCSLAECIVLLLLVLEYVSKFGLVFAPLCSPRCWQNKFSRSSLLIRCWYSELSENFLNHIKHNSWNP